MENREPIAYTYRSTQVVFNRETNLWEIPSFSVLIDGVERKKSFLNISDADKAIREFQKSERTVLTPFDAYYIDEEKIKKVRVVNHSNISSGRIYLKDTIDGDKFLSVREYDSYKTDLYPISDKVMTIHKKYIKSIKDCDEADKIRDKNERELQKLALTENKIINLLNKD